MVSWIGILGTVEGILRILLLLTGVVLIAIAYFRGKNRVALLGGLGLLIVFLLSCCLTGWGLADARITRMINMSSARDYYVLRSMASFIIGLLNLGGWSLIIAALWMGSKRQN